MKAIYNHFILPMKPSSPLVLLAEPATGDAWIDSASGNPIPKSRAHRKRRWSDDARIVWRGSNLLRVATVLHALGQPTYMHVIATKSGLSPEDTGKVLSRLYKKNFLTRDKNDKKGTAGYFRWSMSDDQYDQYLTSAAMTIVHIDTELRSVFAKIRLLENLQKSPVFGSNPVLKSMIEDYRDVWRTFNEKEDPKPRG